MKPLSTSTPSLLLGKSLMCPTEALTVYPLPRYLPIVFALAGDSTMTSDEPISWHTLHQSSLRFQALHFGGLATLTYKFPGSCRTQPRISKFNSRSVSREISIPQIL